MSHINALFQRALGGSSHWFASAGLLGAVALLPFAAVQAQVPCCFDDSGFEEIVEETVEEELEQKVDDKVRENIEDTIEESIQDTINDRVEATVEDKVAAVVEESVESSVEDVVEGAVIDAVEEATEDAVAQSIEASVGDSVESSVEVTVAGLVEERLESEVDSIVDHLEAKLEVDEARINTEQWLVMAEPEVFEELASRGYLFDRVTDLPGMGMLLAEVAAPSSFDISEVRQGVLDVVGSGRAEIDMNHLYTASAPVEHHTEGLRPDQVMDLPEDTGELALRLGMIDSQVALDHPALSRARINSKAFVAEGARLPSKHGTAIASILAGQDADYRGLAPNAELYAASVFVEDAERGEIASTVSLVRALDWLMSSGVDVINVSLAGPPNRLLEKALERAAQRDVLILAAAGNGGPIAAPMYPAAYPSVMAVTAVDPELRVFRLANRGDYLDISAPGVGLVHADAEGGYATSSGTSFAVPFAATAAARLRHSMPDGDIRELLIRSAEDLGPPGYDEIYGHGLLHFGG